MYIIYTLDNFQVCDQKTQWLIKKKVKAKKIPLMLQNWKTTFIYRFSFLCYPQSVPTKEQLSTGNTLPKGSRLYGSVSFYPYLFILKLSWKLISSFSTLTGNNSKVNRLLLANSQNTRIIEGIMRIFQLCLWSQHGMRYLILLVHRKKNHLLKYNFGWPCSSCLSRGLFRLKEQLSAVAFHLCLC